MLNAKLQTRLYRALLNKDRSIEGHYLVGVRTTGIFCRLSCGARKPKKQNVEFFDTAKAALLKGYRPCKVCRPMQAIGESPDWLLPLQKKIESIEHPRISDQQLRDWGFHPVRVRRWFLRNHRLTFQGYLRSLRIAKSYGQVRTGRKVVDVALESGYESLSGFTEAYKRKLGKSPVASRKLSVISLSQILSPLGPLLAGASDKGLCLLEFTDRRMLETQIKILEKRIGQTVMNPKHPVLKQTQAELNDYFAGKLRKFSVKLDFPGTPFQQKTWQALLTIPYGETCSYQDQAIKIGRQTAVRAVANANGQNRISIIIPCHRVIGSDQKLVGYGGGLWRKKFLLKLEGARFKE